LSASATTEGTDWLPAHESFAAWWRLVPPAEVVLDDGEVRKVAIGLAVHHDLLEQVKVKVPGAADQTALLALGRRYGAFVEGDQRLVVLDPVFAAEILSSTRPADVTPEEE